MGVIIGVIVGYVMGRLSMAASLISRGGGLLAERLQTAASSSSSVTALRPTG